MFRSEELLKGLVAMKFYKPSKIQEKALPLLMKEPYVNFIGQSQSGTGKTAAFTLSMLNRVDVNNPKLQAICLSPARELARQTLDVVEEMAKFTKITTKVLVPDSYERNAKIEAQVVVGTPGTMLELIRRKMLDTSSVKILVLDEADNMVGQPSLKDQSKRVKAALNKKIQVVLFSATFDDDVYKYALEFVPNPKNEIRLKHTELNVKEITQIYMDIDNEEERIQVLTDIYSLMTIGSSIIFTATKATANTLYRRMKTAGHAVSVLHSDLDTESRDKLIDQFRSGASKVLITTNVLSRGIDIPSVNVVINFDLPTTRDGKPDPETYLHRIGRTGRFGRKGIALSFVQDQKSFRTLQAIQNYFGLDLIKVDHQDLDKVEKVFKKAMN